MLYLVGFDGSNSSKEALDLACSYAKTMEAEILVVTSMDRGDADNAGKIKNAENQLEWAESHAKKSGLTATSHLLIRGMSPGEDVVQYAQENAVDALFIGIRRRSKVDKLLFGSNAQYMILKAPCPVMTVK